MSAPDPIGIRLPAAFDKSAFAEVNLALSSHANAPTAKTWRVFAAAWNGIVYRLRDADERCRWLSSSLRESSSPPPEERYLQEAAIFGFFSSAASAIECLYLAAYCAASLRRPSLLKITKPGHLNKYASQVVDSFMAAFPLDALSEALDAPMQTAWWSTLFEFRNALMHRGSLPRRTFLTNVPSMDRASAVPGNPKALSDDWSYDFELTPDAFVELYSAILSAINTLIAEVKAFLDRHA
jgi:hypothetical protein